MNATRDRLFQLLPAVYRIRDNTHAGGELRALLAVLEEQLELLESDVERLYDDWFIETCQEWVVPYIGDLLGARGLVPVEGPFSQRGLVANTIAYRRGKGTAAVLEQLARDVTGWGAKAVEYFELLAATRAMNHRRRSDVAFAEIRDADASALAGTPFERAPHLVDVRHVDRARGRYNIPNVGLNLWRLQSYPLELAVTDDGKVAVAATAKPVPAANPALAGRYTFSPLGQDLPLFNVPRAEGELTQLAGEPNIAAPLRRRPLHDELEERRAAIARGRTDYREMYFDDRQPVFRVVLAKAGSAREIVPPEEVVICDLSDPERPLPEGWRRPPSSKSYPSGRPQPSTLGIRVGVDPVLGRLALPAGKTADVVEVAYAYGYPGDLGGGPYDRRESVAKALPDESDLPPEVRKWQKGVTAVADGSDPALTDSLEAAVAEWNGLEAPAVGVIAVMDSRTYLRPEPDQQPPPPLEIEIPPRSRLFIIAGDWPPDERSPHDLLLDAPLRRRFGRVSPRGRRPHLAAPVEVHGSGPAGEGAAELVLDGLLLEHPLKVLPGHLERLRIAHCTLVPQSSRLDVEAAPGALNGSLAVEVERSISGPVKLADTVPGFSARDTIVDAAGGAAIDARGADLDIQGSTVVGETDGRTLEAGNSIFVEAVRATRRQAGCVRYCYLPLASHVPRPFRCHPRDMAAAARVAPAFTSLDYGAHPSAYGQLAPSCPGEIAAGAENDGEMGAFNFLGGTGRLTNLTSRLDEFVPFGLEAGVFFVT
jgi:hypothetical protein